MTEQKGIRKAAARSASEAMRPAQETVGEMIRQARVNQGLTVEGVSAAINIRAAQLRAIEDGNLDLLPGMTYALGFVRSYATYLKLNSAEVVHKFKVEHGATTAVTQSLHYPEPIGEGHQPNWIMIGLAGLCVVALLGAWAVFSDGDGEKIQAVEQIPAAPAVGTMTGITNTTSGSSLSTLAGGNLMETPPAATIITSAAPSVTVAPVVEAPPAMPQAVASSVSAVSVTEPPLEKVEKAESVTKSEPVAKQEGVASVPPPEAETPVLVKRGKSRITIVSNQASWVEIKDASQKTILKKVLRPGDKYFVPDTKGLTLLTANAGGLDILVDGKPVQSLGKSGEIVRGVDLDPSELKKVKMRTRN